MPSSKGWRTRRDERSDDDTPIGRVLDGLLLERSFARGLPIGRLSARWPHLVGPRIGSASAPVSLEGGTLVVAASSGAWGAQVRFLAEEIRAKVNAELGDGTVDRVHVVVRDDPAKGL
jgi:predicted nucleic acid-binding Zn ribbon protein